MAKKLSKRMQTIAAALKDKQQPLELIEAFKVLKQTSSVKFDETAELHVCLGVDPRKSDQVVRGSTPLPNGTGKTLRVAVFTQGANADKAKEAGADIVGFEDLAEEVKKGQINFDVVIASPDAMRIVGQLGQILGPKGLMPNPKVGTVTPNVAEAVKQIKAGQAIYRTDKNGIIHCGIGKLSFSEEALQENCNALIEDLKKAKPAQAKGVYFKRVYISSTMGPGLEIDKSSLPV